MINVIRFLGCGSAFNPLMGNTSAYFKKGDNVFLIDAGETVFSELFKRKLLAESENIYVLITHTHGDHVGSLPSILSYTYYVLGKKVTIVYPDKSLIQLLDLMGISRDIYKIITDKTVSIENVLIQAVEVKHEENIKCFGYILDICGKKIYYSGDSYEIPVIVEKEFIAGNISEIYQDTTEFSSDRPSHCPLDVLEKTFPEETRKNIFCMHFSNDFLEKLEEKGFNYVQIDK